MLNQLMSNQSQTTCKCLSIQCKINSTFSSFNSFFVLEGFEVLTQTWLLIQTSDMQMISNAILTSLRIDKKFSSLLSGKLQRTSVTRLRNCQRSGINDNFCGNFHDSKVLSSYLKSGKQIWVNLFSIFIIWTTSTADRWKPIVKI